MSRATELRAELALLALDCIPPSLRKTLAYDVRMRDKYDIRPDTILKFGDTDFEAPVSAIVHAVRRVLGGDPKARLRDVDDNDWSIDLSTDRDQPTLFFTRDERQVEMHGWLTLSPDRDLRLRCLEALATDVGLPPKACSFWRQILEERSLTGEEVRNFLSDLHNTPHVQEQFLANRVGTSGLSPELAAPSSRTYFERLVGSRGDSASIERHAAVGARERLAELASWRPYEGFLQSLYMASHPDISAQIRVDHMSSEELVSAFDFVLRTGDRVSQLGAIEVGFRVSADRPEVNPTLSMLVDLMRADDLTDRRGGLGAYSLLYVLVSSELSTRQQLDGEPPFYRRLAALAQAGVIQRQMVAAGVALKDSAFESVVGEYYLRALVDLRLEPRRHPTLAFAEQMQAHFLRRVLKAAIRYESEMSADLMEKLGYLLGPDSLRQAGQAFILYRPGPLAEPEENRALPAAFARTIQVQLDTNDAVEPADFSALRTSATSFRVDKAHADLAAAALTRSDNRLANVRGRTELLDTLAGLASVAAIARSEQLADTLRVVVRRYRRDPEFPIALFEVVQILLVAAASRAELADWADFVGDCLTELAFGDLEQGDGEMLHGCVRRFCEIVPELWATCGSADAALMAYNGSILSNQGIHNTKSGT